MANLAYTVLIGFPFCVVMCAIGLACICTVVLAPVGIACVALGVKWLTLRPKPTIAVR